MMRVEKNNYPAFFPSLCKCGRKTVAYQRCQKCLEYYSKAKYLRRKRHLRIAAAKKAAAKKKQKQSFGQKLKKIFKFN